jgi:hypothetical protein
MDFDRVKCDEVVNVVPVKNANGTEVIGSGSSPYRPNGKRRRSPIYRPK